MNEIIKEVLNQEYRDYLDEVNHKISLGWIGTEEIVDTVKGMCDDFEGIVSEKTRNKVFDYLYKKHSSTLRYYAASIGTILQDCSTLDHYNNVPNLYCVDAVSNKDCSWVTIPECIQIINDYAFCYCDDLNNVAVENKDAVISPKSFYGCRKLEFNDLTLPKCVTEDKLLAVSLKYFALKQRREKKEIEVIDHSFIDYDGSSREVFDTPLYKDFIENELSKFYAEFVPDYKFNYKFNELFSGFRCNRTLCKLGFLSHDDMKKYDQYFDTSVEKKEIVEKAKDIVRRIDEKDNDKYSKLKEDLNSVIEELSEDLNGIDYKNLRQKLYKSYSGLLDISKNKDRSIDTDLLNDVKEVIDDISCISTNIIDCYGVYVHDLDEIFLCLDNIFNDKTLEKLNTSSSIFDNYLSKRLQLFEELTKSILVHEYTHFLHKHVSRENAFEGASSFEIRTVEETIAETIEFVHAKMPNNGIYNMDKWINEHSGSGVFPGWPYAGEIVLANRAKTEKGDINVNDEKKLVDLLIEVSCKSYKTAYDLLMIFSGK